MLAWSTRIAHRYTGAGLAQRYGARNAVAGELLVRLHIEKVVGFTGVAD